MTRKERRAAERQARKQEKKEKKPVNQNVLIAEVCWHFIKDLGIDDVRLFMPGVAKMEERKTWEEGAVAAAQSAGAKADARYKMPPGSGENIVKVLLGLLQRSTASAANLPMSATWYDQGLPTIEVGHKLAASMMVTAIGPQVLKELRMPFQSFCLTVPKGLVFMHDMSGQRELEVERLRMGWIQDTVGTPMYVFYGECSDRTTQMFGYYRTIDDMYDNTADAFLPEDHFLDTVLDDLDKRSSLLCRRLLLNACLMMTEGKHKQTTKPGSRLTISDPRLGPPTQRMFKLTQPVTHNFRDNISKFLRSGGGKVNVQCIVSGHWKLQPYGVGLSERKCIFIEPYWRGPKDAPIALRTHKLQNTSTKDEALTKYFEGLPHLSPGEQKIAEHMGEYFKDRLDLAIKEGDIAHRARPPKRDATGTRKS